MCRPRWALAAASALLGLMAMPSSVSYATGTTTDDPGASAALGSIYFSSVLDDSGIGSGHSGSPSAGGGGSGGGGSDSFTRNLAHKSNTGNTTTWGGSDVSKEIFGDIAPGNSPDGYNSYKPIFGDDKPGGPVVGMPGGSSDSPNLPDAYTIAFPPGGGPDVGGYLPDEILQETPPVASSVRIVQVPEPASLALFGAGLLGLGLMSRRRKAPAA